MLAGKPHELMGVEGASAQPGGLDQDQSLGKERRDVQAEPLECRHRPPVRARRR